MEWTKPTLATILTRTYSLARTTGAETKRDVILWRVHPWIRAYIGAKELILLYSGQYVVILPALACVSKHACIFFFVERRVNGIDVTLYWLSRESWNIYHGYVMKVLP